MTTDRLDAALRELADALRAEIAAEAAPATNTPERLLDIASTCAALSLQRSSAYAEMQAGRLRSIKARGRRLFPASAIADYIEDRRAQPPQQRSHPNSSRISSRCDREAPSRN